MRQQHSWHSDIYTLGRFCFDLHFWQLEWYLAVFPQSQDLIVLSSHLCKNVPHSQSDSTSSPFPNWKLSLCYVEYTSTRKSKHNIGLSLLQNIAWPKCQTLSFINMTCIPFPLKFALEQKDESKQKQIKQTYLTTNINCPQQITLVFHSPKTTHHSLCIYIKYTGSMIWFKYKAFEKRNVFINKSSRYVQRVSYFCKRGNFVSNYVISSHTHSVSVLYNFSSATLCGTYTYFH